jgi:hypothetical protein
MSDPCRTAQNKDRPPEVNPSKNIVGSLGKFTWLGRSGGGLLCGAQEGAAYILPNESDADR